MIDPKPLKGRGAVANPASRFETEERLAVDDGWQTGFDEEPPRLRTVLIPDATRSIIATNKSPDVAFSQSINPYRGCEHGCVYCFARPTHGYLGMSPGLDFESRILFKANAAELLTTELARPKYCCRVIALGVNTDAYQPAERKLGITRSILEVLSECDHPVALVTKSAGILRDIDILSSMAARNLVSVTVSVTTLEATLARRMEPRAAAPNRRLEVVSALAAAGIPAGVLAAPMIPGLNDSELEAILAAVAAAGGRAAGYVLLRLPWELKQLFTDWLEEHYPDCAQKVLNLIRQSRGGNLNDPSFDNRQSGTGVYAKLLQDRFEGACRRLGLVTGGLALDASRFKAPRPVSRQLALF